VLGHDYGNNDNDNNAAVWQASQSMFGKYDFMNANPDANGNTQLNQPPTSASTQALFKSTEQGLVRDIMLVGVNMTDCPDPH
jgi:hypothetical protein